MINLDEMPYWTPDHLLLREKIRGLLKKEIEPIWNPIKNPRFNWKARELFVNAKLSGIDISIDHGGLGLDFISHGVAYEECGRFDVDARELIGSGHARILEKYGSPKLKKEWLPKVINGRSLIGVAVTEPEAGSDIRAIKTKATRIEDNYLINGIKGNISRIQEAEAFLVFAKTKSDETTNSLSLFLVNVKDCKNIKRYKQNTIGLRGWSYGQIKFDNVVIPESNLIGKERQGFEIFEEHFSYWRVLMSLLCLGAAAASIDEAILYAKTRSQFGRPLYDMWPVAQRISEALTRLFSARLLCYQALWKGERNLRFVGEAAMSKWYGIEVAHDIVESMMLIFGQKGYEAPGSIEKRWRDIQGFKIADGTNDVMKTLISREIMGKTFYNDMINRVY